MGINFSILLASSFLGRRVITPKFNFYEAAKHPIEAEEISQLSLV
jgi:hypothetical protein